jgi:hypothetical protein
MKNIIKAISLLIIFGLGLFSCKTASIMKRHYNKGYYVSKKHAPAETKTEETTAAVKTIPSTPGSKSSQNVANITTPEVKKDVVVKDEPLVEKTKTKRSALQENLPSVANTFGGPKDLFRGVTSTPRDLKKLIAQDDVARDALSLLWILIVILLIVYIIGLLLDLFGLGPIFHILGVIVLVLLLLWLLRII